LEDRLDIDYARPLLGYGRRFIDGLVSSHLNVKYGKCVSFDYEVELRSIMKSMYGQEAVNNIFPEHHVQSKVIGRKAQFLSYSRVKNY
jgi:predicted subunit of tRNA(5-methylaminomethyl-2-thiouridylate) methyltransferase